MAQRMTLWTRPSTGEPAEEARGCHRPSKQARKRCEGCFLVAWQKPRCPSGLLLSITSSRWIPGSQPIAQPKPGSLGLWGRPQERSGSRCHSALCVLGDPGPFLIWPFPSALLCKMRIPEHAPRGGVSRMTDGKPS